MRNGIEISYFIPFKLSSDVCGDNGLPVCPNATRILGVGKRFKIFINSFLQSHRFVNRSTFKREKAKF